MTSKKKNTPAATRLRARRPAENVAELKRQTFERVEALFLRCWGETFQNVVHHVTPEQVARLVQDSANAGAPISESAAEAELAQRLLVPGEGGVASWLFGQWLAHRDRVEREAEAERHYACLRAHGDLSDEAVEFVMPYYLGQAHGTGVALGALLSAVDLCAKGHNPPPSSFWPSVEELEVRAHLPARTRAKSRFAEFVLWLVAEAARPPLEQDLSDREIAATAIIFGEAPTDWGIYVQKQRRAGLELWPATVIKDVETRVRQVWKRTGDDPDSAISTP